MAQTKRDRVLCLVRDAGPLSTAEVRYVGRLAGDEVGFFNALNVLSRDRKVEFGRHQSKCAISERWESAWTIRRGQ